MLHKLGRPTNGLLSEAELAELDVTSWTELMAGFRALNKSATGSCFSKGSSQFRGVNWDKGSGKWIARIGIPGGGRPTLGLFSSEEDAACAYDRAAHHLKGG